MVFVLLRRGLGAGIASGICLGRDGIEEGLQVVSRRLIERCIGGATETEEAGARPCGWTARSVSVSVTTCDTENMDTICDSATDRQGLLSITRADDERRVYPLKGVPIGRTIVRKGPVSVPGEER